MQVKILEAMSSKGLEKKMNEFITENVQWEIIDIQLAAGFGNLVALIRYEENSKSQF